MKTKIAVLNGKPDTGNLHVRFAEREVISAKPRRGSLAYDLKLISVAVALVFGMVAVGDEVDDINSEIAEANAQLSKVQKKNPHVYYAEKDNPGMNVQKKMRETHINRIFMCPYHKGFMYTDNGKCEGCSGYRDHACKAQRFWLEWNRLVELVPETEQCDAEEVELREKIKNLEVKKRKSTSALMKDGKKDSQDKLKGKRVIRIKRSTLDRLLEEGSVESDNLLIKLIED